MSGSPSRYDSYTEAYWTGFEAPACDPVPECYDERQRRAYTHGRQDAQRKRAKERGE